MKPRQAPAPLTAEDRGATAQADALRSNQATRLERITVAVIRAVCTGAEVPNFGDTFARAIVVFARSIDAHLPD